MLLHISLALLAGALLPLQPLINARLGDHVNGPVVAAFASFVVGTLTLAAYILLTRMPLPALSQFAGLPPWLWLGGVMGGFFVTVGALTVPKLGAAGLTALVVAAQLTTSVLYDHYGVLQAVQPMTPVKLVGALMLFGGAYLILRP